MYIYYNKNSITKTTTTIDTAVVVHTRTGDGTTITTPPNITTIIIEGSFHGQEIKAQRVNKRSQIKKNQVVPQAGIKGTTSTP